MVWIYLYSCHAYRMRKLVAMKYLPRVYKELHFHRGRSDWFPRCYHEESSWSRARLMHNRPKRRAVKKRDLQIASYQLQTIQNIEGRVFVKL